MTTPPVGPITRTKSRIRRLTGDLQGTPDAGLPTPSWRRISLLALLSLALVIMTGLVIYLLRY